MDAREQILQRFAGLSPTLQAAARFVVDHPNEVVVVSMRTLAEHAGVQPATLVRLAQQLGYDGWPALKTAFAQDLGLGSDGQRYGQRAQRLAVRGRHADLVGELFAVQQRNLEATQAHCGALLGDAARLLKRAKTVHVAGFRASHPVAYALFYGYRLFRNSVQLIGAHAGGLDAELRAIERHDAVVVASFAPYSSESVTVIEHARAAGARVVALTDSRASPLALGADLSLLFAVDSPSFFPSVAAAVALTEALLEQLVADGGEAVATHIGRVERQLFDSGAYRAEAARRPPAPR
ncbi:MAG: MurR/RpiR family transcriptional regulator [Proteobacteria bacterium]|nr:MurR/RpiR family transcriptional regulator [Pseudomonadota bacterium]